MTPHGHVHWNELNTTDPDAAAAFYGAVLGWDVMPVSAGDAQGWLIKQAGSTVGGLFAMTGPGFEGIPSHWFTYVAVDDLDAALARVTEGGGIVARPPITVPRAGRFAVIQDPTGAYLGLITPGGA